MNGGIGAIGSAELLCPFLAELGQWSTAGDGTASPRVHSSPPGTNALLRYAAAVRQRELLEYVDRTKDRPRVALLSVPARPLRGGDSGYLHLDAF